MTPARADLQPAPRKAWASHLYMYTNGEAHASIPSADTHSLEDEIEAYLLDSQVAESSIIFWQVSLIIMIHLENF